jgi:multidrug resistance efflux pump
MGDLSQSLFWPPRRRTFLLVLIGSVLCIFSAGTAWFFSPPRNGTTPSQDRKEATAGGQSVACLGVVDVENGVLTLSPAVPGRVLEVPAQTNDAVSAGVVLLRVEDDVAQADLQKAEAALRGAEAQLVEARKGPDLHKSLVVQQKAAVRAARHDLAAARLLAARKEQLATLGQVNKEEVQIAREQVAKLEAAEQAEQEKLRALELRDPTQEIARAEAEVSLRRAVLDQARYALRQYTLTAPIDGHILRVLTQPGELFDPHARRPALLFLPKGPRIVRAEVEQEFASRVVLNQRALVTDDTGWEGPGWTGHVVRIADWYAPRRLVLPDVSQPQGLPTLECIIHLEANPVQPRIGQRVRVRLLPE